MGSSVLAEIVTLVRDHPYVSCSLLVFLTPPFFPILKFFSPLLISTALFLVALVTMGPQFEDSSEEERELLSPSEFNPEDESGPRAEVRTRDLKRKVTVSKDIRPTLSHRVASWKESGLTWVEQKLRNENWRGASLNDENVSILQEAFAHRAQEKPRVMMKLATRRIPAEEEESVAEEHNLQRQGTPEFSNSGPWNSFHASSGRSFETAPSFSVATNTRDLPHDFFSPHPSFSRRHDPDSSLFDNVEPPPIEHDMPPQITGPASVTAPLLKYSFEDASDSDDYDHHHSDHDEDMHLEFGERSLDAESISQDELSMANGTYGHPPPFTVQEEDLPSSSGSEEGRHYFAGLQQENREMESSLPTSHDEVHSRGIDLHDHQPVDVVETVQGSAPQTNDVPTELLPTAHILHEEHSIPAPMVNEDSHPPSVAAAHEESHPPSVAASHEESHPPSGAAAHEESHPPSAAPAHEESPQINEEVELQDIPELEDVVPVENEIREVPAVEEQISESVPADDLHTGVGLADVPASHEEPVASEVTVDHSTNIEEVHKDSEVPAASMNVPEETHHVVERSMSLPVAGSLATALSVESASDHEDSTPLDTPLPDFPEPAHQSRTLGNAISLPATSNPIHPLVIPRKTVEQGPLSPDTDLGYATTPDHERQGAARRFFAAERYNSVTSMSGDESELSVPGKQLSTKEKLSNLEFLCNSIPTPSSNESSGRRPVDVAILRATTDEQVIHVSDRLKGFIEDSPSKKFQPDAPQLQITPPSTKVQLNALPSKSAILASALGRPSIRPVASSARTFAAHYASSSDSSGDEQIELDDSDPEPAGSGSDSEFEGQPAGNTFKPPPKLPARTRTPPHPVSQGKTDAEPVKK